MDLPVRIEPLELGGQIYAASPEALDTRLDISRPSGGYAFRLRFPLRIEGPCMRCLEPAAVETEVDAREIDQHNTDDEELRSPYVLDDELDLGRWAHDAALLAIPTRFLCRPDCAGLCPTCGESLNDADPRITSTTPAATHAGRSSTTSSWTSHYHSAPMAVPKKRTSSARRDKRRANHKAGEAAPQRAARAATARGCRTGSARPAAPTPGVR